MSVRTLPTWMTVVPSPPRSATSSAASRAGARVAEHDALDEGVGLEPPPHALAGRAVEVPGDARLALRRPADVGDALDRRFDVAQVELQARAGRRVVELDRRLPVGRAAGGIGEPERGEDGEHADDDGGGEDQPGGAHAQSATPLGVR
jgi:hypothetical protein